MGCTVMLKTRMVLQLVEKNKATAENVRIQLKVTVGKKRKEWSESVNMGQMTLYPLCIRVC